MTIGREVSAARGRTFKGGCTGRSGFTYMSQITSASATSSGASLPCNVKILGGVSLLNDITSEMIFPLQPNFLLTVLLGNRFYLGVIEGLAECVASFFKLSSGGAQTTPLGVDDFGQTGSRQELYDHYGIGVPANVRAVEAECRGRKMGVASGSMS